MSLKYRDASGIETPVAGLNGTSGELVPSVALYQKGYLNSSNLTDAHKDVTILDIEHPSVQYRVTFSTTMPDTDYVVIVDVHNTSLQAEVASMDKTVNGFIVTVRNLVATMRADRGETTDSFTYSLIDDYFNWKAFKLMTDEVHEADAAHIAQNTANFAPAFSEVTSYAVGDYVTYGGVLYKCTTAHTAGVWVAGHFTQVTVGGTLGALNKYAYLTSSQSWMGEWTEFGTAWTPFYSFTAPYSGKYRLHSSLIYNIDNTSAINVNLRYYNATIPTTIHLGQIASYGNSRQTIAMDCIVELNAGDIIQLQFQSESMQTIRWIQRDNNHGDYWQYLGQ